MDANNHHQWPTVYVVDDDQECLASVRLILERSGIECRAFGSAEEFLEVAATLPDVPSCLLVDVRLPAMSGLGLLDELNRRQIRLPAIMTTAFIDVTLAVEAMKKGAVDFLQKPVNAQALLEHVQQALDADARHRQQSSRRQETTIRLKQLSQRERQVFDMLIDGKNAKQIAAKLNLNSKTVMRYRRNVLDKLHVSSVVQLMRPIFTHADDSSGDHNGDTAEL